MAKPTIGEVYSVNQNVENEDDTHLQECVNKHLLCQE